MTLSASGFDQSIEFSNAVVHGAVSALVSSLPNRLSIANGDPPLEADARVDFRLVDVWFRNRPRRLLPTEVFGRTRRTADDEITFDVELTVTLAIACGEEPRTIEFTAWMEICNFVEVRTLPVRPDRNRPHFVIETPCIVIDFNQRPAHRRDRPRIHTSVSTDALRHALDRERQVVEVSCGEALHVASDADAIEQRARSLAVEIELRLIAHVQEALRQLTDWRLDADNSQPEHAGIAILYANPRCDPDIPNGVYAVQRLGLRTTDQESLIIGVDYFPALLRAGWGVTSKLRSKLQHTEPPERQITVATSNQMLLKGIVRPALANTFGIPLQAFCPSEHCAVMHDTPAIFEDDDVTIHALLAVVTDDHVLRVLVKLTVHRTDAQATLDMRFNFGIKAAPTASHPHGLAVTARLINASTAVSDANIPWDWWLIGFTFTEALERIVQGSLLDAIKEGLDGCWGQPANAPAAPRPAAPTVAFVPAVGASAPRAMSTPYGSMLALLDDAYDYDLQLVVTLDDPAEPDRQMLTYMNDES